MPRFSALFVASLALAVSATSLFAQRPAAVETRAVTPRGPLGVSEQSVVRLFESAAPSVAYITTERLEATSFFTAGVAQGAGSGFVRVKVIDRAI
jgi:2-alkenal reductase